MVFHRLASILLLGFAANTDNLTIGAAYGVERRVIRWEQNVCIAFMTTLATLAAMAFGRQIRDTLPARVPDVLGGALLLAFAAWNLYREGDGIPDRPPGPFARVAGGEPVRLKETLFLSAILSINNVGLAIAGGIGGAGYIATALSIFSFSVAMLAFGQGLGGRVTRAMAVPRALRLPVNGNVVLALAGVLMLVGY
ncbi:MAG TPA: hypothetical protein VHS58_20200 [Acetobacteraceae bacterium]|nr:hypothetical protein [Acetobacteraceae bacterium]